MKSILISIQPKWCKLIANGKKSVEVRKSAPKLDTPFKCYIYCNNQPKYHHLYDLTEFNQGKRLLCVTQHNRYSLVPDGYLNGKVIGEFVCDEIDFHSNNPLVESFAGSCLTVDDLSWYAQGKPLYGWHITDLKIYDKPKELSEFGMERPPQSWGYVEKEIDYEQSH